MIQVPCGRRYEYWDGYDGPLTAWCNSQFPCSSCKEIQRLRSELGKCRKENTSG